MNWLISNEPFGVVHFSARATSMLRPSVARRASANVAMHITEVVTSFAAEGNFIVRKRGREYSVGMELEYGPVSFEGGIECILNISSNRPSDPVCRFNNPTNRPNLSPELSQSISLCQPYSSPAFLGHRARRYRLISMYLHPTKISGLRMSLASGTGLLLASGIRLSLASESLAII